MIKTNKQNSMIMKKMIKAERAITDLIKKGITILSVEMAHNQPRIEIQTPSKLSGETLVIRGTKNGIREDINFSTHNGCTIYWKQ